MFTLFPFADILNHSFKEILFFPLDFNFASRYTFCILKLSYFFDITKSPGFIGFCRQKKFF